jgi:hypothetical protein
MPSVASSTDSSLTLLGSSSTQKHSFHPVIAYGPGRRRLTLMKWFTQCTWYLVTIFVFATQPVWADALAEAGIVQETAGHMQPGLEPYVEIPYPSTIVLDAKAQLTFVHYRTCLRVTVAGPGSLMITRAHYQVNQAIITHERVLQAHCYDEVKIGDAPTRKSTGGPTFRESGGPASISASSVLVLVGGLASSFVRMRVSLDDTLIATYPIDGPRLPWPDVGTPLDENNKYRLELETRDAKLKIAFSVIFRTAGQPGHMLLIRVD